MGVEEKRRGPGGWGFERGMLRKRLRQEEQPQRLLPMTILERHIFPYAFERLSEALDVLMVCKDTFAMLETREFWAPFLGRVMKTRVLWMKKRGFLALAGSLERVYQLFPSSMTVLDAVKVCAASRVLSVSANPSSAVQVLL